MLKRLIHCSVAAIALWSCSDDTPRSPLKWPPEPAERTLLVYMAADNDMGINRKDQEDIAEMQLALDLGTVDPGCRVLVYRQGYKASVSHLMELKPGLAAPDTLLWYSDGLSSVDPAMLRRVLDDVDRFIPSDRRGLVLWSHSMGWTEWSADEEQERINNSALRSFGLDHTGAEMSLTGLAGALSGHHFDFIYFDSCYMGGVEVAYELRHSADMMAASATEMPYDGMPYDLTLPYLAEGNPIEAARVSADYYIGRRDRDCPYTIGVIDLSEMDALARATAHLYAATEGVPADYRPQRFTTSPYCRYFDFADYASALGADDDWHAQLARTVLYEAHSSHIKRLIDIKAHCGLSTHIVTDPEAYGYNRLQWWADVATHIQ